MDVEINYIFVTIVKQVTKKWSVYVYVLFERCFPPSRGVFACSVTHGGARIWWAAGRIVRTASCALPCYYCYMFVFKIKFLYI